MTSETPNDLLEISASSLKHESISDKKTRKFWTTRVFSLETHFVIAFDYPTEEKAFPMSPHTFKPTTAFLLSQTTSLPTTGQPTSVLCPCKKTI